MDIRQVARQIGVFEKRLVDGLLCILLLAMIFLACLQIGLRTFFSSGLLWADPLLRYLVIWCGMFGAVVATREKKHIAIDVLGYLAAERIKPWIGLLIDFFSSLVAAALTWAAILFVRNEFSFGSIPLLSIPSWGWALVFPLGFGLITLHFLAAISADIKTLVSSQRKTEPGREK
ncbi:TRAP-type C4-dicarboxylate transport system, small permease component [Desulfocapsa sulfexigens DSM 10523]|uniref:TRAP-type C4-dicarboxylate transport system, small permease component n=1 Tax=Desulfocapsa sulfexigens (strain DSM 10523 / SB164P1) TaxID=1167006 RepID=M1P3G0_DESSD|nr:TRAP transporter small permease [Desulfocapsa sulfexigens]AGF77983.1 TRAP-type C4-dicarboxylate transport system, small permease component [Desulfocapsa sulfexigens DSM 10523]